MKKYWLIAFSFLLFISQSVLAEQCDLKGQKYFTIQFDVIGSPGNLQEVYIKKGNKRWQTLWYTEKEQKDSDYIFNEQGLVKDVHYQVRIINDGNNNILKYYLKRQSSANDNWVFIEQQKKEIASGQLSVYSNTGLDVDDLTCEESSVEPEEPPPFDQCEFFPQPIQSWITEGSSDYADFPPSNLNIQNPSPISGWTDAYVNDPRNILQMSQSWDPNKTWNVLKVGFDQVGNSYFAYEDPNSVVCNGMGCYPGNEDKLINQRKAETPAPLDIDFLDQDIVYIDNTGEENQPKSYKNICNANSVICKYEENGDLVIITLYKDLKELNLSTWSNKNLILKFLGDRKIETFKYDASGSSLTVYFSKLSIVSFGRIEGPGSAIFAFESNAKVNIVDSFTPSNPLEFKYIENSSDYVLPIIYGPKAKFLLRSNGELKGYLLAKEVEIPNSLVMEGSITTNLLTVASGLTMKKVTDGPECWEADEPEVEDEYELTLQPSVDYSLICSTQLLQFQVNNAGKPTGEFTGSINVSPFANLTLVSGKGTGSNGNYTPNGNGELWFDLSSSVSQSFTITGTLNPKGGSSSAIGTYHFVPYKFAAEDQYVIANKPENVAVKVLGCDTDDKVIDIGYNGQPTVTSEWQAPLNGVGNVTFSPNFNAGNVTADSQKLVMEESGIRTVTMTDANFDCSDPKYNCPIEGGGPLQGSFTVYSRPWTFAICSSDGKSMDGNIEDRNSVGFASAGSPFDLHIRPLRWVSSSGDNSDPQVGDREIETSAYCSSPVTQNFFATDDSLKAKVLLTHNVAEPEDGNNGELSGSLLSTNRDGIDSSYLPFHNLAWDEVGVLRVNADLEGKYLGMTVNQGYRNIGRFYPAYFKITQSQWSLADQNNIAYLSQPYDSAELAVTPYALGGNGNTVQNYHRFNPLLQATISLLEDDDRKGRLVLDTELGSWGSKEETSQWYLDDSNAVFQRAYQASLESGHQVSIVDGPYNTSDFQSSSTAFGFTVIAAVDPVDSRSESQCSEGCNSLDLTFPDQPPARYGRMRLMDVGGTSVEPIAVPLRVEFWQGSRFVTNTQDNGSTFSTDENLICKQMIWSYSGNVSTSTLSGEAGKVSQGESSAISATPSSTTENIREQVRFWLRLDDDDTNDDSQQQSAQVGETSIECPSGYLKQPWLRYNWRAKGDEDPSAVVTFGIFRGNDRVIFRGEPGLTGH